MKIKPRRMKKYTPRRRRSSKVLQKQQLKDFEHLLNMDLGSFLVLHEEGTIKQMVQARSKMRSDLHKYGSDMEQVARDLGEGFPQHVKDFLKSLVVIVQNSSADVDPALVNEHRKRAQSLLQHLQKRI